MKHSLPLLAVLAATLATPLAAQDMSQFLNPHGLAHSLGLAHSAPALAAPRHTVLAPTPGLGWGVAPRIVEIHGEPRYLCDADGECYRVVEAEPPLHTLVAPSYGHNVVILRH